METETVSPDENVKSLDPGMPEVFYFGLFNVTNLYVPLLLSSSFYLNFYNLLEKEIQISLFKEGRQYKISNIRILKSDRR